MGLSNESMDCKDLVSNDFYSKKVRHVLLHATRNHDFVGDRRVESISILPSGMSSERWATSMQREPCRDSEVAVEITLKETCVKKKSDAWHIVKELCIPVLDLIDWSLSMPCSVQGIFEIYGIEAAQKFIFQVIFIPLKKSSCN